MAYRELELTLLSAQDLKSVNLITRMDVYAVVSISGDPLTRQSTAADTYGGRNPCWNATFRFAVPPTAAAAGGASLHVLLRAERFLGDRDVGEVVVPLAEILAEASGVGPQPPKVASYHVRKLHRWEPRGTLSVSYRLGPVVAPVLERAPEKPAYALVAVQRQPSHHHPSAVEYQAPPAPARPQGRVVAEHHDEAAQKKSPVTGYPAMGVPQQASHPQAKPEAYRPPPSPPSPRPAAVHAAGHGAARAPTPPSAPTPPPTRTDTRSNGLGQPGPTHVYMGPHTQIIFGGGGGGGGGGGPITTAAGVPTWTTSPARSTISPAGKNDVNWSLLHDTQGNYAASAADSMSVSVISPRSRNEDRWRPSVLSQSQQHDTHRQAAAASPFSSRSSSFSSPLSPYSSAHPSPSSAHSSTRSPYSPHPSLRSPAVSDAAEVTHGTNNTFRSASSRGAAISSPLPSSSPMVPNHSHGEAVTSPFHSSSPMVPKHSNSSVAPSLRTHPQNHENCISPGPATPPPKVQT